MPTSMMSTDFQFYMNNSTRILSQTELDNVKEIQRQFQMQFELCTAVILEDQRRIRSKRPAIRVVENIGQLCFCYKPREFKGHVPSYALRLNGAPMTFTDLSGHIGVYVWSKLQGDAQKELDHVWPDWETQRIQLDPRSPVVHFHLVVAVDGRVELTV
jgi:hypothetical protein